MTSRAFLEGVTAEITRSYPVLANGLLGNQLAADDPLWEWATLAADHVVRVTGGDARRIEQCTEAFVVTSLDFLRLQARFMKTGTYAHSSASETSALYSDAALMSEYLDGLALSYAMWPNHTRMLQFYVEHFTGAVPRDGRVLEIGPGHGLFASVMLARRADVHYLGVDISPRSVEYSAAAFAAAEIDADRCELVVADATDLQATGAEGFDAAICCEVLEHVDEPSRLLVGLRGQMKEHAPAFVSTVANMEAEDHVYLFHDLAHIRSTITDAGFTIDADQPLALAGARGMTPQPLNYSAIIRSAR
jgi:2-polyprenyl-3-methyl-5-hydroxy-6-metoxy-1,4-benzoquinol methylase